MRIKSRQGTVRELSQQNIDLPTISKESIVILADNGPSGASHPNRYKEVLPEYDPFPDRIIWWDSPQKNYKLIEKVWEYGDFKFIITKITYIYYNPDTHIPMRTVVDYIHYRGPFEYSRTRVIE